MDDAGDAPAARHAGCFANRVRGLWAIAIVVLNFGCAAGSGARPAWAAWAERQGGLAAGASVEQARAAAALDRLRGSAPGGSCPSVHVLAAERACAYAWPDGTVFVTGGLLRVLSDDELAAAIAHELGHLSGARAAAGGASAPAALEGFPALSGDHEACADAIACDLLDRAGLAPAALAHALEKVRDDPLTPPVCREPLGRRVRLLEMRAMAPTGESCTNCRSQTN
jgi:Zn-dependent protease with chaperone function